MHDDFQKLNRGPVLQLCQCFVRTTKLCQSITDESLSRPYYKSQTHVSELISELV